MYTSRPLFVMTQKGVSVKFNPGNLPIPRLNPSAPVVRTLSVLLPCWAVGYHFVYVHFIWIPGSSTGGDYPKVERDTFHIIFSSGLSRPKDFLEPFVYMYIYQLVALEEFSIL